MTNRAVDNCFPPGMSPFAYCYGAYSGSIYINGPNSAYEMMSAPSCGPWTGSVNIQTGADLTSSVGSAGIALTLMSKGASGVRNQLAFYSERQLAGGGGDNEWTDAAWCCGFGVAPSNYIVGWKLWQTPTDRPTFQITGDCIPNADNTYNLGTDALRWANVYCDTLVETSDARLKRDIVDMDKDAATAFVRNLTAVTGRFKKPKHEMVPDPALEGKTIPVEVEDTTRHNWFIAQNVRDSLRLVNEGEGQAIAKGILLHEEVDGQERLGLSYKEFTPILCAALQKALDRIDSLEARIALLESK